MGQRLSYDYHYTNHKWKQMDTSRDRIKSGIVLIVEDDDSLRRAIALALKVRGFDYLEFDNARDVSVVLAKGSISKPTCMLLDIRLGSGPSGLTVFDEISGFGLTERVPVIFMTGHGDLETAVAVMRNGAFDFVTKPFSTPELIKKIESALLDSASENERQTEVTKIRTLTDQLTEKEREVMRLMIAGKTNREIAELCGNSTRTVELHRARIFDKLEVSNAVELVRVLSVLD